MLTQNFVSGPLGADGTEGGRGGGAETIKYTDILKICPLTARLEIYYREK